MTHEAMMDDLAHQESRCIYLLREVRYRYSRPALLWSAGKDSTALLWMCRKAFLGKVPFPVVHIGTSYKLPEIYAFRDGLADAWDLDLVVRKNVNALTEGMGPVANDVVDCCHALKTVPLQNVIAELGFDAVIVGIRRDEHGVRAKERYVSPRDTRFHWDVGNQPPELWDLYGPSHDGHHDRIHPLLHMTEMDVWRYTEREHIPVNPLYFSRDGWRYRSIGCASCCVPVSSSASTVPDIITELAEATSRERAGRAQDKESEMTMQKLRSLGYM